MEKREERDSLGKVLVPKDCYYGAQTQRSRENFRIGSEKMPREVIHALAAVKKAAAFVNCDLGFLDKEKRDLISGVCDEIIAGTLDDHFPLVIWQTGSGTQTNMNVNEVISNRAIEKVGGEMGSKDPIHPNDHVNMSQSSNDAFPTAMHIAAVSSIVNHLFPQLDLFIKAFEKKSQEFEKVIKVGRTHLMDAVPLTIGQEFSGYAAQLRYAKKAIETTLFHLSEIALGGTAVGTGINAPSQFGKKVADKISEITAIKFYSAENKFEAISAKDALVSTSGALRQLAAVYCKIANDIRLSASGPRCGLGELILPANEPGSSIMPGKVNPTQCEAMTMVAAKVMGNDVTIGFAGSQGIFQLNVYMPVMIASFLQSVFLLSDTARNFTEKCLLGIEVNTKRVKSHLERSLMLATILNREIGYDKASQIVKKAYEEDLSLKEAAVSLKILTSEKFDEIVQLEKMIHPS